LLGYPRAGGGPGCLLTGHVSRFASAVALAMAVGIAVLAAGTSGAAMAATAGVVALCLGLVFFRWLGGATGDCLGTVTEVAETAALVVAAGLS
jgi:cobalamin synthase